MPPRFLASIAGSVACLVGLLLPAELPAAESSVRPLKGETDLRDWLENMVVCHRFSDAEVAAATGLTEADAAAARERFGFRPAGPPRRETGDPLLVLPYPGGRHPRIGFLDGAVRPRRESKVSVFAPWPDGGYAVADIPEAVWSDRGLIWLAHEHVPTVWTAQGIELEPLEWSRKEDGSLEIERTLPDGVRIGTRVAPGVDAVRMEMWLVNGSDRLLKDLRVQNCVLLKGLTGFDAQTNDNKVFSGPYAAARNSAGDRWVITAWEPNHRTWGNPPCPCIHSDPQFPDCPPGETRRLSGWLSFYEGTDVRSEFERIDATGWRKGAMAPDKTDPPQEDPAIDVSPTPPAARQATPPSSISVPPGFRVELLRSAQEDESSWISMTFDPQGRIVVGLDDIGLARLAAPEGGAGSWSFERLDDTLKHCRGVLYAHDSLYVNATDDSGFYRLRDLDGDGRFEHRRLLKRFDYRSRYGHGPNQIALGPDGMLYLAVGNDVSFPEGVSPDSPYRDPKPDRLLPDLRDAGQDDRVGYVVRTDPEGREWTVIAGGFRNQVDVAFGPDGEMFTWDADMEWDVGLPWYRPTRLNHVVSGGEYGWRWGTMKWPAYYQDSLPANLETGLGSPTGLAFGAESQFPASYRDSLFMADWQHGRILAVTLTPRGATYDAEDRLFAEGGPLNVCDLAFGPDGALYFITGGRGSQSGLYRISYDGPQEAEPAALAAAISDDDRELRRRLEAFHTAADPASIEFLWPHLGHADRWVRHAARVALERQDLVWWQDRLSAETDPLRRATACLALVRVAPPEHRPQAIAELLRSPLPTDEVALLTALRVFSVAFARGVEPIPEQRERLMADLAARYPAPSAPVNRELCELLVALKWPRVVSETLPFVESAAGQEGQIHYARALLRYDGPWSPEERAAFLRWLRRAKGYSGGNLFTKVLAQMEDDFKAGLSPDEREVLADEEISPAAEPEEAVPPRTFVRRWTMDDLEPHLRRAEAGRDVEAGRRVLAAANCLKCHRSGLSGSPVGPDLTSVGRRFDVRAIAESIVEPSKVVDPKYRTTTWVLASGRVVTGRASMVTGTEITVETSPLTADSVKFSRDQIESSHPSEVSPMPSGLLDTFTLDEILDLLGYLRAAPHHTGSGGTSRPGS